MKPWEQQITELLQEAQSIAVRFDIKQDLTAEERQRAKNNIGIAASITNVEQDNYKIDFQY